MCFSASASFSAALVLGAVGVQTWTWAGDTSPLRRYAAIPLLFAAQQVLEGLLWQTLAGPDSGLASLRPALTYAYLLMALGVWPLYVPWAVLPLEPRGLRRRWLQALLACGAAVSLWLIVALVRGGATATPAGGHIDYGFHPPQVEWIDALYLAAVAGAPLCSSRVGVRRFGVLTALGCGVALAIYAQWFISMWCFVAALLSVSVLLEVRPLPALRPAPARPPG
jgi:hypothetical protein